MLKAKQIIKYAKDGFRIDEAELINASLKETREKTLTKEIKEKLKQLKGCE